MYGGLSVLYFANNEKCWVKMKVFILPFCVDFQGSAGLLGGTSSSVLFHYLGASSSNSLVSLSFQ